MTSRSSAAGPPASAPRSCSAGRGAGSSSSTPARRATLPPRTCRASSRATGRRRPSCSRAARAEVARYGVELVEDRVVDATAGFTLRLAGGRTVQARHVLLATGATDELPDDRGRPRALGPRLPALPVLPRLGGARPADRRARIGRPSSTPTCCASGRDDVILFTHTPPSPPRARDARTPADRRSSTAPSSASSSTTTACTACSSPTARTVAARRALHPPRAARARRRPRRRARLRPARGRARPRRPPTAARACPASGRPATRPTRARRSSPPPAKAPPSPSRSTPSSSPIVRRSRHDAHRAATSSR